MSRELTTCEKLGTQIKNVKVGTIGIINGDFIGGFTVYIPAENITLRLPFCNIDRFVVIE